MVRMRVCTSMCVHICAPQWHIERQRNTCRGQFFPSTTWVLEIKLGSKCLYPLNHVTSPKSILYTIISFHTPPMFHASLLLSPLPHPAHYVTGDRMQALTRASKYSTTKLYPQLLSIFSLSCPGWLALN